MCVSVCVCVYVRVCVCVCVCVYSVIILKAITTSSCNIICGSENEQTEFCKVAALATLPLQYLENIRTMKNLSHKRHIHQLVANTYQVSVVIL